MKTLSPIYLASLYLVLACLFWAGNFMIGKYAFFSEIPPLTLVFYRWSLVWIILLPFTYKEIIRKPKHLIGKKFDRPVTGIMAIVTAINVYQNVDIVGHTLYVESKGNTQTYSHNSHHEQALIDQRIDSVNLLDSYRKEGKLNLLNPEEESILFS